MRQLAHRATAFGAAFAGVVLGLLFSSASHAQFPSVRILPEAPLASHRVYLELGIAPCRILTTDVIAHGPTIRVVEFVTGSCQAFLPAVGNTVVPLDFFPEGTIRIGVSVDGVHRVVDFQVAPARQDPAFVDDGTAIVGEVRRADHSLEVARDCRYDLVTQTNDARTEIVLDRRAAQSPHACTPAESRPVSIGFPTPGQHLVILKYAGIVARTQLITVANGFEKLDYSDLWGVAEESGWGLTLHQHGGDRVFIVVYGYRADGRPLWLSMNGPDWDSATRLSGPLYVSAGSVQSGPFDASKTSAQSVGDAVLEFTTANSALLTIRGLTDRAAMGLPAQRSWTLKRQGF